MIMRQPLLKVGGLGIICPERYDQVRDCIWQP